MNPHLNDEQFSGWLLGSNDRQIAQHLAACDACQAEGEALRKLVAGCRESARAVAERDETFWARQRLAIGSRLRGHRRTPYLRLAVAAVALLLVFAAFVLTRGPHTMQQAKNEPSDDVLLQQVENALQQNYPVALAPAVLIDQERSRALSSASETNSATPATPAAGAGGAFTTSK